jgi:phage gpG-like protein
MAQELTGRGIGWADVGVTVEGRPGTIAVTGRLARCLNDRSGNTTALVGLLHLQ